MKKQLLVLLVVCAIAIPLASPATAQGPTATSLRKTGPQRGICVVLGRQKSDLAIGVARTGKWLVFLQVADGYDAVCRAADKAGLLGKRLFVARGGFARIGLADNVADVVVAGQATQPLRTEILRVLRPGGRAMLGSGGIIKPARLGADDWTHHYHGPDNNPQSRDRIARAPFLTQFIAEPRYGSCPQAAVSAAGRIFMAFGHVAWHQREEVTLNTLIAMSGYNGTELWRRKLPSGFMVDRSTMIATPKTLYLADGKSCKLIDAATGKVTGQIAPPADQAGGTFWKWMALQDGVLYALIGKGEPPDAVAKWRRKGHGWPWGGISKGYNERQYTWGFSKTLLALDAKTGKIKWRHQSDLPIDSRSLCMAAGRIFLCTFGKQLTCIDAASGSLVWRRTDKSDPDLFKAVGAYRPGHGYVGGWKSTVYLKCTDKAVYFIGPQVHHITAVGAKDGKLLWTDNARDLHVVIRDDGLYTIGPQKTQGLTRKLDPLTGKVLATFQATRRACTRSTGSADGIYFRASGGSQRLVTEGGPAQQISPMRPSCLIGVMIANGHLYWVPWTCDCNLQMFGVISCGPAGDFAFGKKAAADRLEGSGIAAAPPAFDIAKTDWPTYRADAARTAHSAADVPAQVQRLWLVKPSKAFEPTAPVAAGAAVFFSGDDGIVRALDAATGKPQWRSYTGAAVRFPPTLAGRLALVASGDGSVYAFEAASGRQRWRFRAAPQARMIPIYGKLLSTWPAAAGVVAEGNVAYVAAGMNAFDGTHVYALDARTGRIKWQNNTSGHLDRASGRGVAVQGDMLLRDGRLYLAGGNAASPGVYDAKTGKCLTAPPRGAGSRSPRGRELFFAKGQIRVGGQPFYSAPGAPVYDRSVVWPPVVVAAANANLTFRPPGGDRGKWTLQAAAAGGKVLWTQPLPAAPVRWGMAVDAAGCVIVTCRDGQVVCFGKAAR